MGFPVVDHSGEQLWTVEISAGQVFDGRKRRGSGRGQTNLEQPGHIPARRTLSADHGPRGELVYGRYLLRTIVATSGR